MTKAKNARGSLLLSIAGYLFFATLTAVGVYQLVTYVPERPSLVSCGSMPSDVCEAQADFVCRSAKARGDASTVLKDTSGADVALCPAG